MLATLMVLVAALVAFAGAFAALAGLEGTCAGRCDGANRPQCDLCPERAEDST